MATYRFGEGPPGDKAGLTERVPQETWFSPKIQVRASPIQGRGTFALAEIAAGETVEIWGQFWKGRPTAEFTADAERAERAAGSGLTVMQWDVDLYSIEERGSDPGYFINHSCDPNLWFRDAFTLESRRAIAPGDELTLDYAMFEAHESFRSAWECQCGTPACRATVTGRDWRRQDLRSRYADRFSPLLNKRITALGGQA